jgi:microsomal triglyceride transfer protein large subunit
MMTTLITTHVTRAVVYLQVGLYASGLSSFVDSNEEEVEQEDVATTAGMEIGVQEVLLRPLEFFNGKSELFGHVWSGTASDSTPAYQAVTVLQDHQEILRLQNGAIVDLSLLGTLSIDLNGQVQISLWNKNARSQVVKKLVSKISFFSKLFP